MSMTWSLITAVINHAQENSQEPTLTGNDILSQVMDTINQEYIDESRANFRDILLFMDMESAVAHYFLQDVNMEQPLSLKPCMETLSSNLYRHVKGWKQEVMKSKDESRRRLHQLYGWITELRNSNQNDKTTIESLQHKNRDTDHAMNSFRRTNKDNEKGIKELNRKLLDIEGAIKNL
eukprot:TRINITY_DN601_c1_g1_i1.p1 TRINITY_DN601_c1_g1~~TRINITY_DN601_c1_g1_i1.p1  ORF type:complete len:178 (-),score=21.68 TRINITY_DN601_c1_g1_i1:24-557(-)